MKTLLIFCIFASLTTSTLYARVMATPSASTAVQEYDYTGTVSQVDIAGRMITVNDKQYFFPSAVIRIHSVNGTLTGASKLKKNTRIGFKAGGGGPGGKPSIEEIWVLDEATEVKN